MISSDDLPEEWARKYDGPQQRLSPLVLASLRAEWLEDLLRHEQALQERLQVGEQMLAEALETPAFMRGADDPDPLIVQAEVLRLRQQHEHVVLKLADWQVEPSTAFWRRTPLLFSPIPGDAACVPIPYGQQVRWLHVGMA